VTPEQEAALVNGGDCFSHWHSEDRRPTQDFLHGLQGVAKVAYPSSNFVVDFRVDYYIVTTSAGVVLATLPLARGNRVITFLRAGGAYNLRLNPSGTETINGTTHLDLTSQYSPIRLLAIKGMGYVQV
jgi:hypothetical protein